MAATGALSVEAAFEAAHDAGIVNRVAVVEPGVVTGDLQDEAASRGLFYPPDPASHRFCTIGGNVAMCAGGPRAVKYGVTRDYVLQDGDIVELRT